MPHCLRFTHRVVHLKGLLALCLALLMSPAWANRLALVIGNRDYTSGALKNPINDAVDVGNALGALGFQVTLVKNIRRDDVGPVVEGFTSRIRAGDDVVVFYAGHGVQVKGVNYLPAVDANIRVESDVALNSINLNQLLDRLDEAHAGVRLLLIDACRDNPYARSFRSGTRGLARVEGAPSGTLMHFATRPGGVAADGDGRNGLYTTNLLKNLRTPGLPVESMLKRVAAGVKQESGGEQQPWTEGALDGEFYFVASVQPVPVRPVAQQPMADPAPTPSPVPRPAPAPNPAPTPQTEGQKASAAADVYFWPREAKLQSQWFAKLDSLADWIKSVQLEVVIVVGHASAGEGSDAYTQKLGQQRAEAVKAYLVQKHGIDPARIYTESKGMSQPVADNKTQAGRAKNQRVEIEAVGTRTGAAKPNAASTAAVKPADTGTQDRRTPSAQTQDQALEAKLRSLLTLLGGGNARINATTYNGRVLLTGVTGIEADIPVFEKTVGVTPGVRSVINEIRVASTATLLTPGEDTELAAKVKAALANTPDLQARAVHVVVDNQVVYLMGLVTADEGARAARSASLVSGVRKVVKVFEIVRDADLQALQGR
jgi:outer membrane protein OmpA-like peptidoglycan-associated protein/osmotically-inducible protein OsmY